MVSSLPHRQVVAAVRLPNILPWQKPDLAPGMVASGADGGTGIAVIEFHEMDRN
jgi:hypothetical protein